MLITTHNIDDKKIAEVVSDTKLIRDAQEGFELMINIYYQGFECIIVFEHQLSSDFFNLKTKMAGELLQKFSNYRMRLAIVGNFANYESKSLKGFIYECNKTKHINFVASVPDALKALS